MSSFIIPDCLVLKYEEIESDTNMKDTTVYIFHDDVKNRYIIRGQRRWSPKLQTCAYSFECRSEKSLADFLLYIIDNSNIVNETLFNYDNFPEESNEITFDFLKCYDHSDYELVGYDNIKFRRQSILRTLRMLRAVKNEF
jgi:hypothetical protein